MGTIAAKRTGTRRVGVDGYVFDVLMRDLVGHDRSPATFLVYLYFWGRAHGKERQRVAASYQEIAEATGLSKSGAQGAVRRLLRRQLVWVVKRQPTAVPEYRIARPWRR